MGSHEHVEAWRPDVPGVGEVLHAHFTEHSYPPHTHDRWTVLLVDTGGVDYALERHEHHAAPHSVTILPPHVPHDGHAATQGGFDKRVVYVDERWLPPELVAFAVREPQVYGRSLTRSVASLHDALCRVGDEFEAESRLALVSSSIAAALRGRDPAPGRVSRYQASWDLASHVRERFDADHRRPPTLVALAEGLEVHPTQVVRAFAHAFGLPPHRYLIGRRIDHARRLLLDGTAPADVAVEAGFYDQSHLTRHFRRVLGVTPGSFVRQAPRRNHEI